MKIYLNAIEVSDSMWQKLLVFSIYGKFVIYSLWGGGVAKNHEYQENRSSDVLSDSTPKCVSIHI